MLIKIYGVHDSNLTSMTAQHKFLHLEFINLRILYKVQH